MKRRRMYTVLRHSLRSQLARIALTVPASWLASHTLPPADRLVYKLTRGRHTLLSLASGLLVVMLTTTGARSGRTRTVPVVAIPDEPNLIVVASNHGKRNNPGWYYNLLAEPIASVTRNGVTHRVRAYEATGEERERLWRRCLEAFPGWRVYDRRTTSRLLPIIVLSPATSQTTLQDSG